MDATTATRATNPYALERTEREYARLRAQASLWTRSTASLFELVGLGPGATCLDAGCGPGETMRLMADRVGGAGTVVGLDSDTSLVATTEAALRAEGRTQCRVAAADLADVTAVRGGPYDLVFARLLMFHIRDQVGLLRRLWASVAPGGHLIIQDYDLQAANSEPSLGSVAEVAGLLTKTFTSLGCDVRTGMRLPHLFAEAGLGSPDGTDVAGHIEPVGIGYQLLEQTLRSVLPAAIARGVIDEGTAESALTNLRTDAARFGDYTMLWPLMIGAWKRKSGPE